MRIVILLGFIVSFLAAQTSSRPAPAFPTPSEYISHDIQRLLAILRDSNQPLLGKTIRKIKKLVGTVVNKDLIKIEDDFDKDFTSLEQMNESSASAPQVDPKALNPVIGAIQTVGDLAQLLVAVGQQVLPGLIAGIVSNSPAPSMGRGYERGMILKSVIGGLSGDMMSNASENETKFKTSVEM